MGSGVQSRTQAASVSLSLSPEQVTSPSLPQSIVSLEAEYEQNAFFLLTLEIYHININIKYEGLCGFRIPNLFPN